MDRNLYDVVMFPMTGALAVCDLNIQDADDEKIYAFAVKRKIMRFFDASTWNTAIKITDERAHQAINQYLKWSRTEGTNNDDYQEKIKSKNYLIGKRRRAEISRKQLIKDSFARHGVFCLWHLTHKDNIRRILIHGILNYYDAHGLHINRVDISDPDAQKWREHIEPHYKRKIHDYTPLYIKPRNPMLYVRRHLQSDLCLIEISLSALFENEYLITDGNAASRATRFFKSIENIDELPWAVLNGEFWPDHDDGKRKMCAEVLVYPKVAPSHIGTVHCYSMNTKLFLSGYERNVEISRNLFF